MNAEDIIKRFDSLKGNRSNWESHWQECADYVLPRKNYVVSARTRGEKKNLQLFDTTSIRDNETLAAGIFSYLCPPNQLWFSLKSKYEPLNNVDEVKRWMGDVTRLLYEALYNSNFNLQIHEHFLDLGCFGTGVIYLEAGKDDVLSFRNHHINEYVISENSDGIVDTLIRKFKFTARQAVEQWGLGNLSAKVREAVKDESQKDKEFEFIHAVFPREGRDDSKIDKENKPFASYYIEVEGKQIITEGGYDEFPYMAVRFTKTSNEVYGRSSAMNVLPEIKLLNKMKKTVIIAAEKVVDPPILIPDDGAQNYAFRTTPAALNYWKPGASKQRPEPLQTNGHIELGLELMQEEKQEIHKAFYTDLFNMLAQIPTKQMTATEVMQRLEEKLIVFAPILGRLQSELFNPMLERVLAIMSRMGLLPPLPEALAQYPLYEIEYTSKLALAVKQIETKGLMQTFDSVGGFMEIAPEIADNFNFDKITQGTAHNFGVPTEWLRGEKERDKIREARAEAQAKMQQQAMLSEKVKPVDPQKPVEKNSIIDMIGRIMEELNPEQQKIQNAQDFKGVFGSEQGERVLEAIARYSGADALCFSPGEPDSTAFNLGARSVYLYINEMIAFDIDKFVNNNKESI